MQRIIILGCSGSGKSTFARALGAALNRPVIHLDNLYWKPGWVETPRPEFAALQEKLVQAETWIIDGNYSATLAIRLERADTLLYFDLPRRVCVWSVLRRVLTYYGRSRPDLAPGCPEKFDFSFLLLTWNYRKRSRPGVLKKLENYRPDQTVRIFRRRKEAYTFLEHLQTPSADSP